MNNAVIKPKYLGLLASLCVWLLCAWVVQQPAPAKKTQPKAKTATTAHRPSVKKKVSAQPVATTAEATTALNAEGVRVDAESGLALGDNMILVKGQCTVCHSSKLILQSHFDRDKWIERIRWMQRTQKLWDLGETEKPILDYLVAHYGHYSLVQTPFDGRRLPLPAQAWYKL